jgi:hypothetical protein
MLDRKGRISEQKVAENLNILLTYTIQTVRRFLLRSFGKIENEHCSQNPTITVLANEALERLDRILYGQEPDTYAS